ncbi:MAG: aminodeoxychorismate/anthranilate synthase component II [Planctomycetota bacterium]|jgi:anthranilate synthase component 2|nr:aminodeoxychorismate/anthranilate synthase component II [Planctomycetota bacterium]MDP6762836.1 aminodeoxychorismate/anthranilate synthase component II [Planctomycetota bacterium]MDP6988486.1 aminodeoxychorismate/anthranilate synthase component II [Planctomycetota bacterium]
MLLLIDNHDSFTFNLYQAAVALGARVEVARNDALSVDDVLREAPGALLLGPGPGRPEDAGICPELLERVPESLPLLGVCLGHQALVRHYGGRIERDGEPVHGRATPVHHDGRGLFADLPSPVEVGRYHSLRAAAAGLPEALALRAWTADGEVMAVEHASAPRHGVQFHPESILTPAGPRLLARFLALAGELEPAPSDARP